MIENYRILYVPSNSQMTDSVIASFELEAEITKIDATDNFEVLFTDDVLNVINQETYLKCKNYQYIYGFKVKMNSYLKAYRATLNFIYTNFKDLEVIFDASIKRYINKYEIAYFANNKLFPQKLYNIEIEQTTDKCIYQTIGLRSIGLPEIKYESPESLCEFDFKLITTVVNGYLVGSIPKVMINNQSLGYALNAENNFLQLTAQINGNRRLFEYYFRESEYILKIKEELVRENYQHFQHFHKQSILEGEYSINNQKVSDIQNFHIAHVDNFQLRTADIEYREDNFFYALKELK